MIFTTHHRESVVTLSEAKGLARWAARCLASLILRFAQDDRTHLGRENSLCHSKEFSFQS
jgi:hypothetical protein